MERTRKSFETHAKRTFYWLDLHKLWLLIVKFCYSLLIIFMCAFFEMFFCTFIGKLHRYIRSWFYVNQSLIDHWKHSSYLMRGNRFEHFAVSENWIYTGGGKRKGSGRAFSFYRRAALRCKWVFEIMPQRMESTDKYFYIASCAWVWKAHIKMGQGSTMKQLDSF